MINLECRAEKKHVNFAQLFTTDVFDKIYNRKNPPDFKNLEDLQIIIISSPNSYQKTSWGIAPNLNKPQKRISLIVSSDYL